MSWNRDIPAEKLSFTMRREFDRQKEETELIEQLRNVCLRFIRTKKKIHFLIQKIYNITDN